MKKYLVEFIGTFFLVTTICMTVNIGLGNLAPLAVGIALTALVYAGGHISGAHYNPAVTICIYLRGKLASRDILPYMTAQLLGAALAAGVTGYLLGAADGPVTLTIEPETGPAIVAEFLGTFALCFVILNVATSKTTEGNNYYGLAIGSVVMGGMYAFAGVSGAVFNPAVALGIALDGVLSFSDIWIYLAAAFPAAILASMVFKYVARPGS